MAESTKDCRCAVIAACTKGISALSTTRTTHILRSIYAISILRPLYAQKAIRLPIAQHIYRYAQIKSPSYPLNAKNAALANGVKNHGGDEGARTLDPHVANVVLSQLSYIPINRQDGIFLPSVALVKHKTKRKYKMADG